MLSILRHAAIAAPSTHASAWAAERPDRRSLEALQRALRRATEALAEELGCPGTPVPEWSEGEWAVARAVAAIHGVSPLLASTARWQGPPAWTQFLAEQKAHTERRFLRIQQVLRLLDSRARESGIAICPLKGAALHALGVYCPGERPMADIDLLVPEPQAERCARLLAGMNFSESHQTWKHRVFSRPDDPAASALGEHADNGLKIELHSRIAEELPRRLVDITTSVLPASVQPGLNAYPSRAGLLLHLLLHTAGALVFREARLLQLNDIARLTSSMRAADLEQLPRLAAGTTGGSLWWAFPPLALVNRYYACVPQGLLQRASADCHWALRRAYGRVALAEVSFSNLWMSAFPAIHWARSPRAMLEYAAARMLHDRKALHAGPTNAIVPTTVRDGEPSQLSQAQLITGWILRRQGRRATLQPVRAALREVRERGNR
jgi:hypothetical protein